MPWGWVHPCLPRLAAAFRAAASMALARLGDPARGLHGNIFVALSLGGGFVATLQPRILLHCSPICQPALNPGASGSCATPTAMWVPSPPPRLQWGGKLAAALDGLAGRLPAAAASQARFVRSALGLPRHVSAVVTNGRVVELPGEGEGSPADAVASSAGAADLEPADFELLELYSQRNQYSGEVAQLVREAAQVRGAGGRAGGLHGGGPAAWVRLRGKHVKSFCTTARRDEQQLNTSVVQRGSTARCFLRRKQWPR